MKTAILSFDRNPAAETWRDGCQKLGLDVASFSNGVVARHQMERFFTSPAEWVFLAGHHVWGPATWMGNVPPRINRDCSYLMWNDPFNAFLLFRRDGVGLLAGYSITKGPIPDYREIKGDDAVQFSLQCKVMLMCGCSIIPGGTYPNGIADHFALFGPHLLLGFTGSVGWEMFNYMLGGPARDGTKIAKSFFANLDGETEDQEIIRNAWLDAGIAGYHDPKQPALTTGMEKQVVAVDPDGQQWRLEKGGRVKGTKFKV